MIRRLIRLVAFALLATPAHLYAFQNLYLDTYDYKKFQEGYRSVQVQTDLRDPEHGESYFYNETGFEYGGSDQYTVGIYGQFVEGEGFSAARLSNRFRINEPNQGPMDMAFQLDIQDANGRRGQDRIQGIFVASKDIEQFNVSVNPILQLNREFDRNGDDEWDVDPALAVGGAIRTGTNVTPTLELYLADDESRLVPGASIQAASNVRLNVGLGIGLEDKADNLQVKTLLNVDF